MRKQILPTVILILVTLLLCSCSQGVSCNGQTHVICVGIDYSQTKYTKLPKNIDDAVQIGKCLRELSAKSLDITYLLGSNQTRIDFYDFSYDTLLKPTFDNFQSVLSDLRNKCSKEDVTIFYFSSHGDALDLIKNGWRYAYSDNSAEGESIVFLNDTEDDIVYYSISDFLDNIASIPGYKAVIGDFCYSGGLVRNDGVHVNSEINNDSAFSVYFSAPLSDKDKNIWCLCSSEYFKVTPSGVGAASLHSPFTKVLLEALGWDDSDPSNPFAGRIRVSDGNVVKFSDLAAYIYTNFRYYSSTPVYSASSVDLVLLDLGRQ